MLDQWYGPDDAFYKLRADDGNLYIVRRESSTPEGAWHLVSFRQQPREVIDPVGKETIVSLGERPLCFRGSIMSPAGVFHWLGCRPVLVNSSPSAAAAACDPRSDIECNQILALSFWKSRQDAERYNREQYAKVNEIISHLVDRAPVIKTFNVDIYTRHKTAGKAA